MRTKIALGLAIVLALGGWAYQARRHETPRQPRPAATPATAEVVKTNLSDYWTETGTVGFRKQRTLRGAAAGVVTWLPRSGSVVTRGGTLFRINDRPVTLFYGSTPMFRDLGTVGLIGRDVRVLADNLRALGYRIGPQPADPTFTETLQAAVRRWQTDREIRPADGTVKLGDFLVLPGKVRVGAAIARLGDDAAGDVIAVSDQAKVVTVEIDASRGDDVRAGQKVGLTLPNGKTTTGTVGSVRAGVKGPDDAPKAQVVITAAGLGGLTSAEVEVRFTGTTVRGVLAVPVGALLALSGGGYAVRIDGGPLIAVKVGLFADGMVQISGAGLVAGARVVTTG
ncbi:peptidoglycan-binding protein [Paractinoplanes rhizophilus]|uniref:Peptidoglycan-binding protein n=1 Tax=Paractinoplanes rhizophilus TaxID=1416877 RepID=A0ABW2I5F1_9ACTN